MQEISIKTHIHNVDLLFDLKERSFNCYGGRGYMGFFLEKKNMSTHFIENKWSERCVNPTIQFSTKHFDEIWKKKSCSKKKYSDFCFVCKKIERDQLWVTNNRKHHIPVIQSLVWAHLGLQLVLEQLFIWWFFSLLYKFFLINYENNN